MELLQWGETNKVGRQIDKQSVRQIDSKERKNSGENKIVEICNMMILSYDNGERQIRQIDRQQIKTKLGTLERLRIITIISYN